DSLALAAAAIRHRLQDGRRPRYSPWLFGIAVGRGVGPHSGLRAYFSGSDRSDRAGTRGSASGTAGGTREDGGRAFARDQKPVGFDARLGSSARGRARSLNRSIPIDGDSAPRVRPVESHGVRLSDIRQAAAHREDGDRADQPAVGNNLAAAEQFRAEAG